MKENENFVIGEEAKQVELLGDRILVRLIRIEPNKKNGIVLLDKDKKEDFKISDFGGFHPGVVEVMAISKLAKAKEINEGDIVAIGERVHQMIYNNQVEKLYVDKEVLYTIYTNDVICKMNYFRDNFKQGIVIKKHK
jgi:co-chaperonin GroES (HSP10)